MTGAEYTGLAAWLTAGNGVNLILALIVLPAILAAVCVVVPSPAFEVRSVIFGAALVLNLFFSICLLPIKNFTTLIPWGGLEMHFALRVYPLATTLICVSSLLLLLIGLYAVSYMQSRRYAAGCFAALLLSGAMVNGALLANNLIVLLFFWEGMLGVLLLGTSFLHTEEPEFALKAIISNGCADLLLLFGTVCAATSADSLSLQGISQIPLTGINWLGFICMLLGAAGKGGIFPFHSWVPGVAERADLPFVAYHVGVAQKVLSVYLLIRIIFEFYAVGAGSAASLVIMSIAALSIIATGLLALLQQTLRGVIAAVASTQTGLMLLAMGSGLPLGALGAATQIIAYAAIIGVLFLVAGAVERRTGTTDLDRIGGLGRLTPPVTVSFVVAAAALIGVPPLNGFFATELMLEAVWATNIIFYLFAILGLLLTGAVMLKVVHSVMFGELEMPESYTYRVNSIPGAMSLPLIILSIVCAAGGVLIHFPAAQLQNGMPFMGDLSYSGMPNSIWLVILFIIVLLLMGANHFYGVLRSGHPRGCLDHITYAPGLRHLFAKIEKGATDPYNWLMRGMNGLAAVCVAIDRGINYVYDAGIPAVITRCSAWFRAMSNGSLANHVAWSCAGLLVVVALVLLQIL
ncbi:MAG: hypothetical protein IKM70_04620 [Firmicutes bacterium]|nr:hypothetical protein [Bacillota bacterium]